MDASGIASHLSAVPVNFLIQNNTITKYKTMNAILRSLACIAILINFSACKPKTTGEKIEDKVKDGFDVRPNEKIRDAAEDAKDAVKDAVN